MTINKKLSALSTEALIKLIEDIYGRYADVDDIIDSHLRAFTATATVVASDKTIKSKSKTHPLAGEIKRLRKEKYLVDYHHAYEFACRLRCMLLDIASLAEESPAQALQACEELLFCQEELINRVDDSDGNVGDALRDGVDLWLEIAAELREQQPQARNWVEAVLNFFNNNDYGCFDEIISNSRYLLNRDELQQLAWRFESETKKALNNSPVEGYNYQAAHASLGIRAVAEALDDIVLYEKSILIASPEPNCLQLEKLIEFAFEIAEFERAQYWLQQPQWDNDKARYSRLHNQLLELQGNIQQLKHNLLQAFNKLPSPHNLSSYWAFADAKEKSALAEQVLSTAASHSDPSQGIYLLLMTDALVQAENLLIEKYQTLTGTGYNTLLNWLDFFDANQQPLAVILCYRLLLTDMLERGYSKAYSHGGNYFRRLLALDKQRPNYQGLANAQEFIRELQAKHWRKNSFWREAGHPNKPVE